MSRRHIRLVCISSIRIESIEEKQNRDVTGGGYYYYETGVLASACLCLLRTLGVPLVKRVVQSLLLSDEY